MARATATLKCVFSGSAANAMLQLAIRNSVRRRQPSSERVSDGFSERRRQVSPAVACDKGGLGCAAAVSPASGDGGGRNSATMMPTTATKPVHRTIRRGRDGRPPILCIENPVRRKGHRMCGLPARWFTATENETGGVEALVKLRRFD